jgi:hypothetical protein
MAIKDKTYLENLENLKLSRESSLKTTAIILSENNNEKEPENNMFPSWMDLRPNEDVEPNKVKKSKLSHIDFFGLI